MKSRKRCRRHRFDPDQHPVRMAMLTQPASADDLASLRVKALLALGAFGRGSPAPDELRLLSRLCLIVEHLACAGFGGKEVEDLARRAAVIVRATSRPGGADHAVLVELVDIADQQFSMAPRAELERAAWRAALANADDRP